MSSKISSVDRFFFEEVIYQVKRSAIINVLQPNRYSAESPSFPHAAARSSYVPTCVPCIRDNASWHDDDFQKLNDLVNTQIRTKFKLYFFHAIDTATDHMRDLCRDEDCRNRVIDLHNKLRAKLDLVDGNHFPIVDTEAFYRSCSEGFEDCLSLSYRSTDDEYEYYRV